MEIPSLLKLTSRTSLNKKSVNVCPLYGVTPSAESFNMILTSVLQMKCLLEDRSCSPPSISLINSNIATWPCVFPFSSSIWVRISATFFRARLICLLSGLDCSVCFRMSFKSNGYRGSLWTGQISSSTRVCLWHSGLLSHFLRKAWNLGDFESHSIIVVLFSSKKLIKGGYAFKSKSPCNRSNSNVRKN